MITLRKLEKSDVKQFHRMYLDYCYRLLPFSSCLTNLQTQSSVEFVKDTGIWADAYIDDDDCDVMLVVNAQNTEKIIGFIVVDTNYDAPWVVETDISVAEIYIKGKYRRQGVGREAVCRLLNHYAKTERVSLFILNKNERAKMFWDNIFTTFATHHTIKASDDEGSWFLLNINRRYVIEKTKEYGNAELSR